MEDLKQWKFGGRYEPHVFLWSLKFDNAHNNVQCKRIFLKNNLIFFCNCKNKQLFRAQVIAMKVTSPRQSLLFSVFNINCSVCLSVSLSKSNNSSSCQETTGFFIKAKKRLLSELHPQTHTPKERKRKNRKETKKVTWENIKELSYTMIDFSIWRSQLGKNILRTQEGF